MMESTNRQFVKYTFYKVMPKWRHLEEEFRRGAKEEFSGVVEQFRSKLTVRFYSLMGMRADAEMMIWLVSPDLETIQDFAVQLARTTLGSYMTTSYSYLAMTRHSIYVDEHVESHHQGVERTKIVPMNRPYLFVYPFVKTHSWYQLSADERQEMMKEHFSVGHKYPAVKIHTSYSYGMDDQEFVLGFETDNPSQFLDLVMELRHSIQRPYTERDTPIFTCLLGSLEGVLENLG